MLVAAQLGLRFSTSIACRPAARARAAAEVLGETEGSSDAQMSELNRPRKMRALALTPGFWL